MEKMICENCNRERPDFALVDGFCDICLVEIARAKSKPIKVTTNDVIAKAKKLLASSDWTQMPDSRPGKPAQWASYREALKVVIDDMEAGKDPSKVEWPTPPVKRKK